MLLYLQVLARLSLLPETTLQLIVQPQTVKKMKIVVQEGAVVKTRVGGRSACKEPFS